MTSNVHQGHAPKAVFCIWFHPQGTPPIDDISILRSIRGYGMWSHYPFLRMLCLEWRSCVLLAADVSESDFVFDSTQWLGPNFAFALNLITTCDWSTVVLLIDAWLTAMHGFENKALHIELEELQEESARDKSELQEVGSLIPENVSDQCAWSYDFILLIASSLNCISSAPL